MVEVVLFCGRLKSNWIQGFVAHLDAQRRDEDEDDGGGDGDDDDVPGAYCFDFCFVCLCGCGTGQNRVRDKRAYFKCVGKRSCGHVDYGGKARIFPHGICIDRLVNFCFCFFVCVDWDVTPRGKL